ncbi:hypothetical protein EG878_14805 [Enterococcus faecalis]|nr:hypothetical protein EG878_14805 [Enterococcus faecalis]
MASQRIRLILVDEYSQGELELVVKLTKKMGLDKLEAELAKTIEEELGSKVDDLSIEFFDDDGKEVIL